MICDGVDYLTTILSRVYVSSRQTHWVVNCPKEFVVSVKGYVFSNVKSAVNIYAESILRNMRLRIERTNNCHITT